jgi:hypothetical protein
MYLYFGFVEETDSTITFATELADNPCGTLYKYFLYASENLRLFLSKSQSLVKILYNISFNQTRININNSDVSIQ